MSTSEETVSTWSGGLLSPLMRVLFGEMVTTRTTIIALNVGVDALGSINDDRLLKSIKMNEEFDREVEQEYELLLCDWNEEAEEDKSDSSLKLEDFVLVEV